MRLTRTARTAARALEWAGVALITLLILSGFALIGAAVFQP